MVEMFRFCILEFLALLPARLSVEILENVWARESQDLLNRFVTLITEVKISWVGMAVGMAVWLSTSRGV